MSEANFYNTLSRILKLQPIPRLLTFCSRRSIDLSVMKVQQSKGGTPPALHSHVAITQGEWKL